MRRDQDYLVDAQEALFKIKLFISECQKGEFLENSLVSDAVIKNLMVIGEALRKVSTETKSFDPSIPWGRIIGLRDRLIHDYFGTNLELVWDVAKNHGPVLSGQLDELQRRLVAQGGIP